MKFAVLSYQDSKNFGDEIQSIAAARLLPCVDMKIPREQLAEFRSDEKVLLVMNGYFGTTASFPPSDSIVPLYISFHIARDCKEKFTSPECIAHYKKWSPIGCRDKGTMQILRAFGIDAYYSKCLSLTLPTRVNQSPTDNYAVDFNVRNPSGRKVLKPQPTGGFIRLSHMHGLDRLGDTMKTHIANGLLMQYEKHAACIVTSRLHCALPCIAMGIPVDFIGLAGEYRLDVLQDIGEATKFYPFPLIPFQIARHHIKLTPSPNLEKIKQAIIENFKTQLGIIK